MPTPTVFISYRHDEPSSDIAKTLYKALYAVSDGMGFEIFMDQHDVAPADLFDQKILGALARTTHFIVLLDNSYWSSDYCRKELAHAVTRFEKHEPILPLFVMADWIKPEYMTLDRDRTSGRIDSEPLFRRIGDLQFLGPFDENRRLEALKYYDRAALNKQIHGLIGELERVMP